MGARSAWSLLRLAQAHEQELEDDRAAIKADAIQRIMKREGLAATPAEKIVETDEAYFLHRQRQRFSVVDRFKADAEYQAAKAEATQASLITPDMIELEVKSERLSIAVKEVLAANRSLLQARNEALAMVESLHNQLRDANKTIADLEAAPTVEAIP